MESLNQWWLILQECLLFQHWQQLSKLQNNLEPKRESDNKLIWGPEVRMKWHPVAKIANCNQHNTLDLFRNQSSWGKYEVFGLIPLGYCSNVLVVGITEEWVFTQLCINEIIVMNIMLKLWQWNCPVTTSFWDYRFLRPVSFQLICLQYPDVL